MTFDDEEKTIMTNSSMIRPIPQEGTEVNIHHMSIKPMSSYFQPSRPVMNIDAFLFSPENLFGVPDYFTRFLSRL